VPLGPTVRAHWSTGLAVSNGFLYALYTNLDSFRVACVDAVTLQAVSDVALAGVQDGHSIFVEANSLTVVSSGNDRVLRFEMHDGQVVRPDSPVVVWAASDTGSDSVHLNSIVRHRSELHVSAFGPDWRTTDQRSAGWVKAVNVNSDRTRYQGLDHPHSLLCVDGNLWFCESRLGTVRGLAGGPLRLSSYTRGLGISPNRTLVFVGVSQVRTGSKRKTDERLTWQGPCGVAVVEAVSHQIIDFLDLSPFAREVYDIVVSP
jgi:hypothetical protein